MVGAGRVSSGRKGVVMAGRLKRTESGTRGVRRLLSKELGKALDRKEAPASYLQLCIHALGTEGSGAAKPTTLQEMGFPGG